MTPEQEKQQQKIIEPRGGRKGRLFSLDVEILVGTIMLGIFLVAATIVNSMLLRTSIDRSRAFIVACESINEICEMNKPCDWMSLKLVEKGLIVPRKAMRALGLGEDYVIEVSEGGEKVRLKPVGFFWGFAPGEGDYQKALEVASWTSTEWHFSPALFTKGD